MPSKKNKYKEDKKEAPKVSTTTSVSNFFTDKRNVTIFGLTLLLIATYLFISFTSYLFTWKADQDKIFQFSWSLLFVTDVPIENQLGRLGAITAHQFFYNWFGVSSYTFVFMIALAGIKFLSPTYPIRLFKIYVHTMLITLWTSVLFTFIFNRAAFPWGGGFGNSVNDWLLSFMGTVGALGLLIFLFVIYLIAATPVLLLFKKNEQEEEEEMDEVTVPSPEITLEADEIIPTDNLEADGMELTIEAEEKLQEPEIITKKSSKEEEIPNLDIEEKKPEEVSKVKGDVSNNFDPTLDLASYKYPTLELLDDRGSDKISINTEELEQYKNQIIQTLNNYNIKISKIKATVGPTVTLYEIVPAPGIRISKIKNLEDDIALSLSALGIRIIAPIPGKGAIGIEVPNKKKETVGMRPMLASDKFQNTDMDLPIALGKTISNEIFIADLAKMPHLLMAGATGQGKSVGLNAILVSLLYKKHPSQLKFVLVDPKKVELTLFKLIENHFLAKLPNEEEAIITDTTKVINTLNALCIEMDDRYNLLKEARVRNIKEYNEKFTKRKLNPEKGHKFMPFIVLVVDEFADLIMTAGKEVENPIARLAQLARAIGIHLIIATQRPSVNIITGTIKANFPARIAFKVTSKIDSRTILDTGGADQLIGRGDMLISQGGGDLIRLQCPFVDTPEVENIAEFIGEQRGYPQPFLLPEYSGEENGSGSGGSIDDKDEYFDDAARIIVELQQGSTSLIQRRLKLGYNRAGRIMDQLEAARVVGPSKGSKARDVLIQDVYQLEQFLQDNA